MAIFSHQRQSSQSVATGISPKPFPPLTRLIIHLIDPTLAGDLRWAAAPGKPVNQHAKLSNLF
jgi:hypothetical protein